MLKAAVMGVVEGLTEFLPISSTGHLILAGALLGMDDAKGKVFDIAIQTGAIFAVILVYWQKIKGTVLALPREPSAQRLAFNVLVAFLPAVVLGLSLLGYAVNLFIFAMGRLWRDAAPILSAAGRLADPVPQALVQPGPVPGLVSAAG